MTRAARMVTGLGAEHPGETPTARLDQSPPARRMIGFHCRRHVRTSQGSLGSLLEGLHHRRYAPALLLARRGHPPARLGRWCGVLPSIDTFALAHYGF
jgi:hypothetical protein